MGKKYGERYCWRHMSDRCKKRYYCPSCGEVQCAQRVAAVWKVLAHHKSGQEISCDCPKCRCPGGPVDLEKDKAP